MKMKLAQRMAMGYYRTKFRALSLVSKRQAAKAAFRLFCTPYSGKPERKAPPVFKKGEKLTIEFEGLRLQGWRWKPEQPNGKKILIVHGFDSCSYRFDRYIIPLTQEGFELVAFDAQGHGTSEGKTINGLAYSRSILKTEQLYGPFYGVMAHSLGALAAALAFEQFSHQQNRKLVLIAPTTETSSAIDNFFQTLGIPAVLQQPFEQLIYEVGKKPVDFYSASRAVRNITAPVLWIHDEEDRVCPYCDTLPLQESQLPHVEFFITKGLGHSGIYRQNNVFKKITDFFSGNDQLMQQRR